MPPPPALRTLVLAALLALPAGLPARADLRVIADIAPVHSLVARVMLGAGEPTLLMPATASPHDYALRPSEAARLSEAEIVFLIGPMLTPWLERPLAALSRKAYVVELAEVPGLPLPPPRPEEAGSDGEDRADERADAHADDHAHDQAGEHTQDHAKEHADSHGHDHDHGTVDPHFWLNPAVAQVWLPVIADVLAERDPARAELYRGNAEAAVLELSALETSVAARMRPLATRGYLVQHDGFRHFEARFRMRNLGAIQLSDAAPPSAARIEAMRRLAASGEAVCLFAEPQLPRSLADRIAEDTGLRTDVLDALGADQTPGPALYAATIEAMAAAFERCLAP